MTASNTSFEDATDRIWDAIVVGAGPSGSVAALESARQGCSVLLVDRSEFPRDKLCGACLSGSAVASLRQLRLDAALKELQPIPLTEFRLHSGRQKLSVELNGGVAVRRKRLDMMLVESAKQAGVRFLSGLHITIKAPADNEPFRQLIHARDPETPSLRAKTVVVATGLSGGRHHDDPALETIPKVRARVGVGTKAKSFPDEYRQGTVYMAAAAGGYVGLARVDDDSLNIAAALNPAALHSSTPSAVCRQIVESCELPVDSNMLNGDWKGTVSLTRQPRNTASVRMFVIGDAAGYVEPFTGEGMAWGIRGGQAVAPFVRRSSIEWTPQLAVEWSGMLKKLVTQRQRWCRWLATALRYPRVVRGLMRVAAVAPSVGRAVARRVHEE